MTGNVRKTLEGLLRFRHLVDYAEETGRCGPTGTLDRVELRRCLEQGGSMEWVTGAVRWVKWIGGILPTETVLVRRGHSSGTTEAERSVVVRESVPINAAVCKLCGKADETNHHMLVQCTGSEAVVAARREWVENAHAAIRKALRGSGMAAAVCTLIQVTDEGALADWGSDGATSTEQEAGGDTHPEDDELTAKMREAWQEQGGVEMVQKGCVSVRFKALLVAEGGLKPEQARDLLRGIRTAALNGLQAVWQARSKARAAIVKGERVTFEKELEAAVRRAEATGQDWCTRSGIADIRGHVMRMKRKQQKKWMQLFTNKQCTLDGFVSSERRKAGTVKLVRRGTGERAAKRLKQTTFERVEGQAKLIGMSESPAEGERPPETEEEAVEEQPPGGTTAGQEDGEGSGGDVDSEDPDDDVPLGDLETFWEAREETGAEYCVLKGTEYMRRKRKQGGGSAWEGTAGAAREDSTMGTTKRTKADRAETRPSRRKRKPHGGAGTSGGRSRRVKRAKAQESTGPRVGSKRKRTGQARRGSTTGEAEGEAARRHTTRTPTDEIDTGQRQGTSDGVDALSKSTMKAVD